MAGDWGTADLQSRVLEIHIGKLVLHLDLHGIPNGPRVVIGSAMADSLQGDDEGVELKRQ